jgi:hypothetical protein
VDGDQLSVGHRRSAVGPVAVGLGGKTELLDPGAKAVTTLDRRGRRASVPGCRREGPPDGRDSRPAPQPLASTGPEAGRRRTRALRRRTTLADGYADCRQRNRANPSPPSTHTGFLWATRRSRLTSGRAYSILR